MKKINPLIKLKNGYKNLVLNKNKSLGVKYNGIDEKKKSLLGEIIRYAKSRIP